MKISSSLFYYNEYAQFIIMPARKNNISASTTENPNL